MKNKNLIIEEFYFDKEEKVFKICIINKLGKDIYNIILYNEIELDLVFEILEPLLIATGHMTKNGYFVNISDEDTLTNNKFVDVEHKEQIMLEIFEEHKEDLIKDFIKDWSKLMISKL